MFQKCDRFPLGAILAKGFLKEQLDRAKDGASGHLFELEPAMIRDPFIHKTRVSAWDSAAQSGWGAEISGNYWTGYIQHAFTANDPEMIETATWWVNTMMTHQKEDGYLGTYYEDGAAIYDDYNAWGTACALRGLLEFYSATGRKDVLDAVHRCLLWFCDTWTGEHKTSYAGVYIVEPMVFCYQLTNDPRLIEFSEDYFSYLCEHDIFGSSWQAMLNNELEYTANHTAAIATTGRLPALLYTATGKREYLKASERLIQNVRKKALLLSGGIATIAEFLAPVASTTETEYCSFTFYNQLYSYMSYITGQAKYGDYMEEIFYNGAQGARKKDERATAYFTSPNQMFATQYSSTSFTDKQVYAPCYATSCCPVNAVAILPEFIRGMFLHRGDDIYVTAYGPSRLTADGVVIEEATLYPFRDSVTFTVRAEKEFSLFLKIPGWCRKFAVTVNGEALSVSPDEDGYIEIHRVFGLDTVILTFFPEIDVIRVDDSDGPKKYPIAFRRGALLFSLPIPERWLPYPGNPGTPLPDGWSWFNVRPAVRESDDPDLHNRIGLRRWQFTYNVAVDEHLSPEAITVEMPDADGYVWETPPIRLCVPGYKAPYLCSPYQEMTNEPAGDYQTVTDALSLSLVPYGCTTLRITYFPKAKLQ